MKGDSAQLRADVATLTEELLRGGVAVKKSSEGGESFEAVKDSLAEAKAKGALLQAEVDRLKAVEAQSLFADASRMAIELAALKEENARLAATSDQLQREAKDQSQSAASSAELVAANNELAAARAEVRELRGQLLTKKQSAAELIASREAAMTTGVRKRERAPH